VIEPKVNELIAEVNKQGEELVNWKQKAAECDHLNKKLFIKFNR
jgi:hypothetical protein